MIAPLPDAAPANWVDRHAPPALRPWLKLGRFDRPTGIWLLMLPGWQGIALAGAMEGKLPDWRWLIAFFVGAALMRAAGCAYNDIVDRDFDAKVSRTAGRPIPSGQITVRQAWAFVIGCCLVSLAILLAMPPFAIALGVGSLALVAVYPFMKRFTDWPQFGLGLAFSWGALMGWAVVFAELAWPPVLLYIGAIAWTIGYDGRHVVGVWLGRPDVPRRRQQRRVLQLCATAQRRAHGVGRLFPGARDERRATAAGGRLVQFLTGGRRSGDAGRDPLTPRRRGDPGRRAAGPNPTSQKAAHTGVRRPVLVLGNCLGSGIVGPRTNRRGRRCRRWPAHR